MPKVKISEYSSTANSNTDVASINIDEGCAPSGINNAIRAVMGHLKDFQVGTNGDPFNGPVNGTVGATTPSTGAFTTLSASSTVSGTGFSTYLASPPAIGGTAAAAGTFTTLKSTGVATLGTGATTTIATIGDSGTTSTRVIQFSRAAAVTDIVNIQGINAGVGAADIALQASGGNVGIGTTSQFQTSRLSVSGTGNVGDFRTSSASGYPVVCENSATGSTNMVIFLSGASFTTVGSITYNGSLTLYNTTSDQRLKENIQDAESASSLIDSLKVRKFDWKESNVHQRYGFVAQELVTVAPEAVHQPTDADEMMAVDYSKLVPMLVKEIQSLRQRVASLESN
jgi:microcompartment protein CcmL/EutN